MAVQCQQVARALPAQQPLAFFKLLQHITVAHLGAHKLDAPGLQRHFNRLVGHQGADDTRHLFTFGQAVGSHEVQQLITVVQAPLGVDHLQTVCVSVQGDTVVRTMLLDGLHQRRGVCGPYAAVDVESVWCTANRNHLGPQFMEHAGGNLVSRSVGCIHHDLHALEGSVMGKCAFAKLDVAACSISQPARLAQTGGVGPHR